MLDLCHDLISYLLFENAILEKKKITIPYKCYFGYS